MSHYRSILLFPFSCLYPPPSLFCLPSPFLSFPLLPLISPPPPPSPPGGTEAVYSHLDFAAGEGRLMASVGASPDFMLTVWDWERENIVLRSKAFSQDIYRVTFSPENPGQLTTSGTGHIRYASVATSGRGAQEAEQFNVECRSLRP